MKKDYYLILRLRPEATEQEIRSAYRRLAIELHPDISGFGSEPFLELQEAYSVLSDPMRRAAYDRKAVEIPVRHTGAVRPTETMGRKSIEVLSHIRPMDRSHLEPRETFHPAFREMVECFWSNFNLATRRTEEQPNSLTVEVTLSHQQAFFGGRVRILVPVDVICRACRGQGYAGSYQCSRCQGNGLLRDEYPLTVSYPAGLQQDYLVCLSLDDFGIDDFNLNVRFRPAQAIW